MKILAFALIGLFGLIVAAPGNSRLIAESF
jgi:hypothetical protein